MTRFTYADGIRQAIAEEMERDPAVFLIGEDVGPAGGVFGVTKGLWESFGPERLWDTPISEEAIVGAAIGAALVGGRPIAEIMFGDFVTLAMDMIVNQAAKTHYMTGGRLSVPMVVRMVHGDGHRGGHRRTALTEPRVLVRPRPRHQGRGAVDGRGCQGAAEVGDP